MEDSRINVRVTDAVRLGFPLRYACGQNDALDSDGEVDNRMAARTSGTMGCSEVWLELREGSAHIRLRSSCCAALMPNVFWLCCCLPLLVLGNKIHPHSTRFPPLPAARH